MSHVYQFSLDYEHAGYCHYSLSILELPAEVLLALHKQIVARLDDAQLEACAKAIIAEQEYRRLANSSFQGVIMTGDTLRKSVGEEEQPMHTYCCPVCHWTHMTYVRESWCCGKCGTRLPAKDWPRPTLDDTVDLGQDSAVKP